ncbi:hypothetical protein GPROT2_00743 [Gammaproteobacteria bacterium]|nr:hypothetical protein [Gammaproteobacteria bacterium]QOJ32536.1 MAG: hypothetical protein HRU81_10675 [Gammaproteobacteria bacterium]CAG0939798.1 hypothetical protein GPROT2_00743 [Gammaproteobacteria bacterium]
MSRRMTIAMMLLSICICALPRVQAQATNWLLEAVMVGVPQTQIVRDPKNRSRYYLCWSDGSQRYGLKFSRTSFNSALTGLQPGQRASLGNVLKLDPGGWTAYDERLCWGN